MGLLRIATFTLCVLSSLPFAAAKTLNLDQRWEIDAPDDWRMRISRIPNLVTFVFTLSVCRSRSG